MLNARSLIINKIFRLADKINETFSVVMGFQFIASAFTISLTIFKLSTDSENSVLKSFMYLSCMLVELFVYCAFGNHLSEKVYQYSNIIYANIFIDIRQYENILEELEKNHFQSSRTNANNNFLIKTCIKF